MNITDLVLIEHPHFTVDLTIPADASGRLVRIEAIDLRLEDLKRFGGVPIKDLFNWLAPVPWLGEGLYLTHDHGVISQERVADIGAESWLVLPDDWWEYALGTVGNAIVKGPKYPRTPEEEMPRGSVSEGRKAMAPRIRKAPLAGPVAPRASRASIDCEDYQRRLASVLTWPF